MQKILRLILFSVLLVQVSPAADRSAAPEGFTWQEVPELKTAFLKPTNWFFKHEQLHGHPAYYITKENLDQNSEFRTGLTVFVYFNQKSVVEYAQKYIDKHATSSHVEKWARDVGSFKEFGLQDKHAFNDGTAIVRVLAVANPKTNTFYLLVFESPESDWDVTGKTGATILDNVLFDDGV